MEDNEQRKVYQPIGIGRLLDIIVILDGGKVYEGMVENAPDEIKKLKYSRVDMGSKLAYYCRCFLYYE